MTTRKTDKAIVTTIEAGNNFIILVITQDLIEAYKEIGEIMEKNFSYRIIDISAQAIQLTSAIVPSGAPGLAITCICELKPRSTI